MTSANSETLPVYEIYALRYASMARTRGDNFISGADPHDGAMPMDFYVWLIRSPQRTVLVDTGFNEAAARVRGRKLIRCPIEALGSLRVSGQEIEDVVLTHLHYDHAGNLDKLPNARFHLQDAEMEYATGRCMCHSPLRHAYSVDDVVQLVRSVYADRVKFHEGDAQLAPGIQLMKIGGHTKGLQAVRVHTARGWVVLASDASHYYENMQQGKPFPIVHNVANMLAGFERLANECDSADHVVPGHDPLVLARYPRWADHDPNTVMLHVNPLDTISP